MLTNNHLPMIGRRNPGIAGDFDLSSGPARRAALRGTFATDRRNAGRVIADMLDDDDAAFLPSLASEAWLDWASDFARWEADQRDEAILDDFGVATFAELAVIVAGDVAEATAEAEMGDSPGWGDTFDPADVQWGFSVRTRP